MHSRPKCSQEGCERDALKNFGGVSWKHREEQEGETFEDHLMQLDQTVRGGNRMVDTVPQGGERRVVDSSSSVDAVTNQKWRDDIFAAEYYEPSKNALLVSDRALFFHPPGGKFPA